MISCILGWVTCPWTYVLLLGLSYIMFILCNNVVPLLCTLAFGPQNLKKKYPGTEWALVTGSSSGIGKEIARALLRDDLNVILIARGEPVFDATVAEFKKDFPKKEVIQINADLSDATGAWMEEVRAAFADKYVGVNFLNAGYIIPGMFEQNSVDKHLANFHCNLTSNVWLGHFVYTRLIEREQGGCVVFTSSSASVIPNPFAVMYGTTKAGLTAFAASLACEGRARGVHVHAIHPSPVNSRFSSGGGNNIKVRKVEAMETFYKFAVGPEDLPPMVFSHIGRTAIVAEVGGVSIGLRTLVTFLGYNFMALATALTSQWSPDYKANVAKASGAKDKKA